MNTLKEEVRRKRWYCRDRTRGTNERGVQLEERWAGKETIGGFAVSTLDRRQTSEGPFSAVSKRLLHRTIYFAAFFEAYKISPFPHRSKLKRLSNFWEVLPAEKEISRPVREQLQEALYMLKNPQGAPRKRSW